MSDLLSSEDNPRGYLFAVVATGTCALLLLPFTAVLRMDIFGPARCWLSTGGWLYRVGLFASIAISLSTPLQASYVPVHVYLAFIAFMAMTAGLAVALVAAAFASSRWRLASAAVGGLAALAFLFLAHLFLTPDYFHGRRWFLGLCEWVLVVLIGAGTILAVWRVSPEKPNQAPVPNVAQL